MKLRKPLVLLLAMVLLFSILPAVQLKAKAVTLLTEEEFAQKLTALRQEYPDGKHWNQYNGVDASGIAKAGDAVCSGYALNQDGSIGAKCATIGYCGSGSAGCTCDCGYYQGWQCFGFANLMAYKIFGSYGISDYSASGVNSAHGWTYYSSVSTYYAGDIVRINNRHSIFITKVTASQVYYVECNNDGPCMIDWDNVRSMDTLKSITTFVVRMQGNTLKGTGAEKPVLTMNFNANGGSISDTQQYIVTTTGTTLQLRQTASLSAAVLDQIPDGTTITALETATADGYTWAKVTYDGTTGWCAISHGLTARQGYYLQSDIVYNHATSAAYTQSWDYGSGGTDGLVNDSTLSLTRAGYTFAGWSTSADGSTAIFNQDDTSLKAEDICPDVATASKTVTLYAIWIDDSIQSIRLSTIGKENLYHVGDALNTSGLSLMVQYKDGTCGTITEGFICSPAMLYSEGTQTVTVTYGGLTSTYTVQVTAVKTGKVNGAGSIDGMGYLLPSTSAETVANQGAWKDDTLQVLCKDGDFYLAFIPWGSTTVTDSNRVLLYLPVNEVTVSGSVPSAQEYYSMNPTGGNNATVTTQAFAYHRTDGGATPIKLGSTLYTTMGPLTAGSRVRVLFEMDGYYCVQTEAFTGFVAKSAIMPDNALCGIQVSAGDEGLTVQQGQSIDKSALTVKAVYSDGTTASLSDYAMVQPDTATTGTKYAVITYGNFSTYAKVTVTLPEEVGVAVPTLTLKYPTLAFKDEIQYNLYFNASDISDVVEMGLITFATRDANGTIDNAIDTIPGYVANADGSYTAHTNGISARLLGDALYFKVYALLSDGTYAYSDVVGYHAVAYAKTILNSASASAEAKALVVAMLNYGAAAQVYFDYKTDSLMNATLTAAQQALVESYHESMIAAVPSAAAKVGPFVSNGGFTDIHPTVSFEGAFSINYYFTPKHTPDYGITFYYWSLSDFNNVEVLLPGNATGAVRMTSATGVYTNPIKGISAKAIDEPIYVAAIYTSGGTTYTSPVIGYSLGTYCKNLANNGNAFGAATAVYGYYAKAYFA